MSIFGNIMFKKLKKEYGKILSDQEIWDIINDNKPNYGGSSSSSSSSSVKKCCANCYYFEIGDVWGHHGAYIGGGGCCCKGGQRRLMFSTDEMHYDELHKRRYCDDFSKK